MSNLGWTGIHAAVHGMHARATLQAAIEKKDARGIQRYFKTAEVGALVGGLFMVLVCVVVAISMFVMGAEGFQQAGRNAPAVPEQMGTAPAQAIWDDTGYISDSQMGSIQSSLDRIAREYHIHVAVYSSTEPAHNVYDAIFSDEWGVVLYVEEHEDYGRLTYYWGSELNDVFTPENIQILNEKQTYLDAFTHDRAYNVVTDFDQGLHAVFYGAEDAGGSAPFTIGAGVFFLVLAPVFYWFMGAMIYRMLKLPRQKARRRQVLDQLLAYCQIP